MASSVPNFITRFRNQADMSIRTRPGISRHRFRGHKTLDGAFSASVEMFTVVSGSVYSSPSLYRKRLGVTDDSKKDLTRVVIDPDDYTDISPHLPSDKDMLFLRVEDFDIALGGYRAPGRILVIPPVDTFAIPDSVISLFGTAPGVSAVRGEKPPASSMSFALPLHASAGYIQNLDNTNSLLVSFGAGMPMIPVLPTDILPVYDGSISDVFVASENASPVQFSAAISFTRV